MPLQQLVEYFNDRIEREQLSQFRPFTLIDDQVYGLFGPLRVSTRLSSMNDMRNPNKIVAYSAHCQVYTAQQEVFDTHELDQILKHNPIEYGQAESVIHFDRLTRTVHMLNYLPHSHHASLLFLDVDPRHILGVKTDHGAYFEEIINRCGLATHQIVITLSIHGVYSRFYQTLLKGLINYQHRGYKIAIKLDYSSIEKQSLEFIERSAADFIGLSTYGMDQISKERKELNVSLLQTATRNIDAKHYIFNCDEWPINTSIFKDFDYWQSQQSLGYEIQNSKILKRCS